MIDEHNKAYCAKGFDNGIRYSLAGGGVAREKRGKVDGWNDRHDGGRDGIVRAHLLSTNQVVAWYYGSRYGVHGSIVTLRSPLVRSVGPSTPSGRRLEGSEGNCHNEEYSEGDLVPNITWEAT